MEHWRFVKASKIVEPPSGNYIFSSRVTGIIFWFMVDSDDFDNTLLMEYNPGSFDYDVTYHAMEQLMAVDTQHWHKKLIKAMKGLKK